MVSALCPAKETLRCQGVGTVTRGKGCFLVVRVPPEGSESAWGALRLGDEVPSAPMAVGAIWDIRDWR